MDGARRRRTGRGVEEVLETGHPCVSGCWEGWLIRMEETRRWTKDEMKDGD